MLRIRMKRRAIILNNEIIFMCQQNVASTHAATMKFFLDKTLFSHLLVHTKNLTSVAFIVHPLTYNTYSVEAVLMYLNIEK